MTTPTRGERVENVVQVVILLAVGGMAGAASFTHVHDWTMANSPEGTPGWFGWANAVISELTPIAAGLEARRRVRNNQPIGYPLTLLVASVALSLAAQVAVAKPGITGWLLSAVPALAFMALVKLVISRTPANAGTDHAGHVTQPAYPSTGDAPATVPEPVTAPDAPASATPTTAGYSSGDVPAALVMSTNLLAAQHHATTGQPITPPVLADRLGVDDATARRLLATAGVDTTATPPARVNGRAPEVVVSA